MPSRKADQSPGRWRRKREGEELAGMKKLADYTRRLDATDREEGRIRAKGQRARGLDNWVAADLEKYGATA